ncbi:MAG: ABC transporter substrate-binding protein [Bacteroidota bacterium]
MNIINAWKNRLPFLFTCFLYISCHSGGGKEVQLKREVENEMTSYARHFGMKKTAEGYSLEVYNPWQNAADVTFHYQLSRTGLAPDNRNTKTIKIPVQRVVCLSTTHVGFISKLNQQHTIVGLSGTRFVYDSIVNQRINQQQIFEVGYEENLDYELIASLKPDVVVAFSITQTNNKQLENLENLRIPVIYNAEYLEDNPLGKAEWVKFFGALYDNTDAADTIFQDIAGHYNQLADMTENAGMRPAVLTGLPYKDVWYVPNSESHLAQMIRQAGGRYLWEGYNEKEVYPLDLEAVYTRAMHANVWINSGFAASMSDILSIDARIGDFPVIKHKKVYNNNRRLGPNRGNDYFESGAIHPHLIVKDMIKIFHPELIPDHKLFYYQKLE